MLFDVDDSLLVGSGAVLCRIFAGRRKSRVDRPNTHPLFRGSKGETKLMRSVFRETSSDLEHWSYNRPMSFGDTTREEIYESGAFPYYRAPGQYVGLANRFFHNRNAIRPEESAQVHRRSVMSPRHNLPVETYLHDSNDMVLLAARPRRDQLHPAFHGSLHPARPGPGQWTSRNNYPVASSIKPGPMRCPFSSCATSSSPTTASSDFPPAGWICLDQRALRRRRDDHRPARFSGDRLEMTNYATSAADKSRWKSRTRRCPCGASTPADSAVLIGGPDRRGGALGRPVQESAPWPGSRCGCASSCATPIFIRSGFMRRRRRNWFYAT